MIRAAVVFIVLSSAHLVAAQSSLPKSLKDVGFDQRLNEQVPLDLRFVDERGRDVRLGEYFAPGRPVILVLAYYRCPMLCTMVLNGLVRGLIDVPFTAGREFDVVVVSFDPREKPPLAAAKKQTYVERYARAEASDGWHFLTGRPEAIAALTQAVGFRYAYDTERDQFAHASGIVMLTPVGRIARYFYDVQFRPRDLRLGLVESSQGKIGSAVDQVLLFCFHYEPTEGRYGTAVLRFVRIGGVLSMLGLVALVGLLRRRDPRRAAGAGGDA
ncbi:MAG TPA: SCO family protein [Pirellulales bacterium]|nr:SCO family protein [Pirellulales bacterium]